MVLKSKLTTVKKVPSLYKYVTLDRALSILKSGEIRMTQPRFLNDPHELCVEVNGLSVKKHFYDHLLGRGYSPEEANDISSRNLIGMVIDQVDDIRSRREEYGVLSLADSLENMLLWAHYANEHRGAVIEIDVGQLVVAGADLEFQYLGQVEYCAKRVDFYGERLPVWSTLFFKSEAWAYEREWRLIRSLKDLRQKVEDVYVIDIPATAIKTVTFGARAFGPTEEEAIKHIQSTHELAHVVVQKASFSSRLVGLEIQTGRDFAWRILHGQHHFGDNWREFRQWVDMESLEQAEKTSLAGA
ncbi:DUF2971 domain-containing protein [Rhizobium sp. BK418]|uniref:DUF2971 domain-containing protein n=1 Tax=Rhizobium sp. BK418 TaxID=2512120 RepID=UPI0010457EEA|nr:DUF2971 domain-containing protein [Rhizobium sp. BK418]TCR97796.1 DUF2971 family protein [Rhizobium sp. BK418]